MTNKDLQEHLKKYPDDAIIAFEYCNVYEVRYNKDNNLILIEWTMTKEELETFEERLKENGYKKYNGYKDSDYTYYKQFGRGNNKYDDYRSNYLIGFLVYDLASMLMGITSWKTILIQFIQSLWLAELLTRELI